MAARRAKKSGRKLVVICWSANRGAAVGRDDATRRDERKMLGIILFFFINGVIFPNYYRFDFSSQALYTKLYSRQRIYLLYIRAVILAFCFSLSTTGNFHSSFSFVLRKIMLLHQIIESNSGFSKENARFLQLLKRCHLQNPALALARNEQKKADLKE